MNNDSYIIIPARISSTRLKNKPLQIIAGKTLIQRVFENASKATDKIYIATDSKNIEKHCKSFTNNIIMTSSSHLSGTDRVCEAAEILKLKENDFIINIQGDEPFIPLELIKKLFTYSESSDFDILTVSQNIKDEHIADTNIVKVLVKDNFAIDFLRVLNNKKTPKHHVGIYAYSFRILKQISQLKPTKNELDRKLEQLRFLDNNHNIYVHHYEKKILKGIDTEHDLYEAEKYILNAD